jgi:hypothetical protein
VDVFRDLMTLQTALKSHVDPARMSRFWFDRDEPAIYFYDSAESLYLWMHAELTRDLPSLPEDKLRDVVRPNTTLVHLTLHPERIPGRVQLLAARGIHVGNERQWTMPYRGQTIHVIFQDVTEASSAK